MKNLCLLIVAILTLTGCGNGKPGHEKVNSEISKSSSGDTVGKIKTIQRLGNGSGGSFYGIFGLSDHKTMFVTGDMGGLSRSVDGGKTWELVGVHNTIPYAKNSVTGGPMVITEHPDDPNVLFGFRAYSLFLSLDKGVTWKTITTNARKHSRGIGIIEYGGKKYLMIGMGYQNIGIKSQAAGIRYLAAVLELPDIAVIKSEGIQSLTKSPVLSCKLITPGASKGYYTGFKSGGSMPVFAGPSGGVWVVNGNPTDKSSYIDVTSHISELKDHIQDIAVDDAVVDGDDLYIVAGGLAGSDTETNATKSTAGIYHLDLKAVKRGDFTYQRILFEDRDIDLLRGFGGFGSGKQRSKHAGAAVLHSVNGVKYIYYFASTVIAFRYKIGDNKIENIARSKGSIYTKDGFQYVVASVLTPKIGKYWNDSDFGNCYGISEVSVDGDVKRGIYKYCYSPSVSAANLMSDVNGKLYMANITEIKVWNDKESCFYSYTSDVGSTGSYMDGVTVEMNADKNLINNDSNGSKYNPKLKVDLVSKSHTLTYYSTAIKDKNISNMVSTDMFFGDGEDIIETFMDAQSYYSPDDGKSWYWIPGGDAKLNDGNFSFKAKDGSYYISERYGIYKFHPVKGVRESFRKVIIPRYTCSKMFGSPWWGENMSEAKKQKFAYDKENDVLVFSTIVNQHRYGIAVIKNFTREDAQVSFFSDDNPQITGRYKHNNHKAVHWIKIAGDNVYFASGEFGVCKFSLNNIPKDFNDTARLTTKIGRTDKNRDYWSSASVVDGNIVLSSLYNPNSDSLKKIPAEDKASKTTYLSNYDASVVEINLDTLKSREFLRPENVMVNGVHPLTIRPTRRFDVLYKKGDDLIGAFTCTALWLYSHDGGSTWHLIKDIPIGGGYTLPGTYPKAVPENRGGGYILTFAFTAARFWF